MNAELQADDGAAYLISAGKWYKIESNFVQSVNDYFNRIPRYPNALPEYHHDGEAHYNASVVETNPQTFALMDRRNIPYGQGPNRIEFCDLYTTNRDIIHVKRYGGSNVLSHLFSQGAVSGELFRMQPEFRRLVNERLPESHRIRDHRQQPNRDEYHIVFAVVSNRTVRIFPCLSSHV